MSSSKNKTGLIFGIIAGIIYILFLFVRYRFYGNNPQELGIISAIGFFVFILQLFIAAQYRKKQLGGYAELKELFGTVFIVIIVAELCYSIFNFIYLKYIEPDYLSRFTENTLRWIEVKKLPASQAKDLLNGLKDQKEITFGAIAIGFARSVILDSIFAMIIAFILKRKKA